MSDDPEYDLDFRAHPERHEIGRGEKGVFKIEPYKSELLGLWGYTDREAADESGEAIYERYLKYRAAGEFPGMDMARKYLQMGYTRAMRYARYPGGQKYVDSEAQRASDGERAKPASSGEKREREHWAAHDNREAALVYEVWWNRVENDDEYQRLKAQHREHD
ncbi:DUF4385 family protein [Halococcus sp. PRR34]|uniref:DUF4385 family protein n=1 Tax=Halococcus sp. PRR34 TaxID=3020830 RepID=UPI0023616B39|nr:DUF4385 family protein [Halococcus sp. PRR34]